MMIMKKVNRWMGLLLLLCLLAACQSYKKVPYLQSYESLTDKSYMEFRTNSCMMQRSCLKTC